MFAKNFFIVSFIVNLFVYGHSNDMIKEIETSSDFPCIVFWSYDRSASHQVHKYSFYSKKHTNIKVGEILQPVNQWQANNGTGSEAVVEGFYQNDNGNYFIDSITTKGTKTASCNACQTYNVETFKITDNGIISMGLRKFTLETYKLFNK